MAAQGGLKLTMGHVAAMQKKLQSVQKGAENVKKKADKAIGKAIAAGLTSGTAFGFGVLQGRTGGVTLPGDVPLELGVGVAAHAAGFFGIGGEHLHSVGNGALATYFATLGRGQGRKMLTKANEARALKGEEPIVADGIKLLDGGKKKPSDQTVDAAPAERAPARRRA